MLKRRSRWLAGAAGLFLVLSMSGVAMGVTPPDAVPDVGYDSAPTRTSTATGSMTIARQR